MIVICAAQAWPRNKGMPALRNLIFHPDCMPCHHSLLPEFISGLSLGLTSPSRGKASQQERPTGVSRNGIPDMTPRALR